MMSLFQVSTVVNIAPLHQKKLNRKETRGFWKIWRGQKKRRKEHTSNFLAVYIPPIDALNITSERKKFKTRKARMIFFLGGNMKKAKSSMAISKIWGPLVLK